MTVRLYSPEVSVSEIMGTEKPTVAFVLSLLAGIFILLGDGMTSMMGLWFGGYQGQFPYGGMMGGYYGNGGYNGFGGYGWMFNMMGGYGYGYGMMRGLGPGFGFMGVLGLAFGIIVIVSAVMLYNRSADHTTWGVLILIFSILSVFGSMMGGFGVGVILGVIGGVLAILWKAPTPSTPHS